MLKIITVAIPVLGAMLLLAGCASAPPNAAVPAPGGIYGSPEAWLCRPGRPDLCSAPQSVTVVAADGTGTRQTLQAATNPPIDCFYVYPTISHDPNPNSSLKAGAGENWAVSAQFAPFASVCRTFAPMYRQITLAGLFSGVLGKPVAVDAQLPIEDVRAAWRHYLAHDNHGRGVVLIGHSQGTRMLIELLKRDIEGKPEQKLLVSAVLAGLNTMVAEGQDAGGTFQRIPLCKSGTQTGCIVSYNTARATSPPPANARFGRSRTPGQDVACVDPVALSGVPVRSMFATAPPTASAPDPRLNEWNQLVASVGTPFIDLPGMLSTACVKQDTASYLALTIDASARGARPSEIPGDLVVGGKVLPDWGNHLIDISLVEGNLVELVRRQGAAYTAR